MNEAEGLFHFNSLRPSPLKRKKHMNKKPSGGIQVFAWGTQFILALTNIGGKV